MKAGGVTHDDEKNEVDEVVEGVGIHHKVHDVDPALQCDNLWWQERRLTLKPPPVCSPTLATTLTPRMSTPNLCSVL